MVPGEERFMLLKQSVLSLIHDFKGRAYLLITSLAIALLATYPCALWVQSAHAYSDSPATAGTSHQQQNEAIPIIGPFGNPTASGADDLTRIEQIVSTTGGASTTPTNVRFINTLRNNGNAIGSFIIGAPVVPPAFSVSVSVDSGATFTNLDAGATLTTPTPVDPGEQRNIDVRVTVPAGSPVDVEFDVVIEVSSDSVASLKDRTIDRIVLKKVEPQLNLVKSVVDLNGGQLLPGDILEYTLTLSNQQSLPVTRTFVAEFIPQETIYVLNSVEITAGPNAGKKTDAADDDQVDYFPGMDGNGQLNIGTGTGAGGRDSQGRFNGGTLEPGESNTFKFQVRVKGGIPAGTVILNGAEWGADDTYPGGKSNITSISVSGAIPLIGPFDDAEAMGPTDQNDDMTRFRVNFDISNGLTTRAGQVRFINTVKNFGDAPGKFMISAPVIPAGFSVQVSVDSGETFSSLDNGGSVVMPTEVNPQETRNIDVRVNLPAGLAVNTNYDVVIQSAWEVDPVQANRTVDRVIPDPNPPNLALVKAVRDMNGADIDGKTVLQGQTIEYSLTLKNETNNPIAKTFIAEFLPPEVEYQTDSVRIIDGANSGAKTDKRGDDQVDYFPLIPGNPQANGQINIFTGAGAGSDRGGVLGPGESTTLSFTVKVKADAAIGTTILNGADWGAEDFYAGGKSNIVSVTVTRTMVCPSVAINPASGKLAAGQAGTPYNLSFAQSGGTNPVIFTIDMGSLPPGLSLDASTGTVSGIPTAAGAYSFGLKITDANGCFAIGNYELTIDASDPGESCRPIICYRSAAYYTLNFGTAEIPNGTVLISGVNSNIRVSTNDPRVKIALSGRLGELNRQYVATQLNILNAGGLSAANVISALNSQLKCYGLKFNSVSLSGGDLSTSAKLSELLLLIEENSRQTGTSRSSDACVLAKILQALNGNSLSSLCHQVPGEITFSSCQVAPN